VTELQQPSPYDSGAPRYSARQTPGFYLELSLFWFALSFLWAGMITIVIQTIVEQLVGPKKDLYLGLVLALGAFVSTVVCLVVGTMSDRSRWRMGRRRPYIIIGSIAAVPVLLLLPHVASIAGLLVLVCLLQFWVNVATSPYQALVPDLVPKERQGTASAYMGMGSLVGNIGGLMLCGLLISKPGGMTSIMFTIAAVLVGAMLVTLWRVPERSAAHNPAPRASALATLVDSFRVNPREHPDFFWLILSRFAINLGFYTALQFLKYYAEDTLHDPTPGKTVMYILVISTFSGLLGNFPAGILSDRTSKKRVVYVSLAITAASALVFMMSNSIPVALGAAFMFGLGWGAFQAVDWALATNLLPDRDEAKFMGVWHVAFTVPQVIAPAIGGPIAYLFNQHVEPGFGYRVVMCLTLIYTGLGALFIHPVRERVIPKPVEQAVAHAP
jgi:MFS family permease